MIAAATAALVAYSLAAAWRAEKARPICVRDAHGKLRSARSIHQRPARRRPAA